MKRSARLTMDVSKSDRGLGNMSVNAAGCKHPVASAVLKPTTADLGYCTKMFLAGHPLASANFQPMTGQLSKLHVETI